VQVADTTEALTGIFDGLTGVPRVAVAVSGGSDSMALLRLVAAWSQQQSGPREVIVLTFDHGLRDGSAAEAARVADWCKALSLQHVTLVWSGEKPSTGIQAKARVARYDGLAQWCRNNAVQVLMTGHTADDQAETVYMRQQRTSSVKSLSGIWPENEWLGVRVLRPLLKTRRDDLRAYLKELGQVWLEDPSNLNEKFERVRVRQVLAGTDIEAYRTMASASQLQVRDDQNNARVWMQQFMQVDSYAVLRLARQPMLAAPESLQISILAHAIKTAGDGRWPEPSSVASILAGLAQGGTQRRSLNGAIVSVRQHVIEIMREPGRIKDRWIEVLESGRVTFDDRFEVIAPSGSFVGPMGIPPRLKRYKDVPALAFSALPVVKLVDGQVISAAKSHVIGISATLCERFHW
jgi:tRNA(Ile)-lysidine synthase